MKEKMTRSQWIVETMSRAVATDVVAEVPPCYNDEKWWKWMVEDLPELIEDMADALVERGYLVTDPEKLPKGDLTGGIGF